MRPAIRAGPAVAWTAALFVVLKLADRALWSDAAPAGWQTAGRLAAIPAAAGVPVEPALLPEALGWPPSVIRWRVDPQPGWWLGLGPAAPPQLWVGSGAAPPELPAAQCLDDRGCPAGWHALSRQMASQTVFVVTTLQPRLARQLLQGLRPLQR